MADGLLGMSGARRGSRLDGEVVRALLLTAIAAVLAVIAGSAFDGFVPSLLVAPIITGFATAATVGRSRVVWWTAVVAGAVGTVVITVLAAGGSLGDLAAIGSGPRRLISTEWPSPIDPVIIGALGLLLAAAVVVATALARRPRTHLLPMAPLLVVLVVVIGSAAPRRPEWPVLVALALLTLAFALTRVDPRPGGLAPTGNVLSLDRTVLLSAVGVAIAVTATATTMGWSDRADPRRTEAADVSAALLDPIEATVGLRRADPPLPLFSISDVSPTPSLALPDHWRLTALDEYDGQRWVPQLTLRPIGERLGAPPPGVEALVVEAEILTDDVDIVPFPGRPIAVDAAIETDVDRVVVRLVDRPEPGTVVRLSSLVAPRSTQAGIVGSRQVDDIARTFTDRATSLAGDGTIDEQLRAIEQTMRSGWQLDANAPGGGQQRALIERFITDTQRGTREQFVTAFVLLVRSLGVDARVATGFIVAPEETTSPLILASTSAAVWPEVNVEGVGWVAFDPVPESETTADDEMPPPPEAQSPAAAQPPIAPPAEQADDTEVDDGSTESTDGRWSSVRRWLVRGSLATMIGLVPILLVVGSVLGWKWRRRRQRLRAAQPASIVRGAWANATDSLIDAGLVIAPSWTDDAIAEAAVAVAPSLPHEARRLAAMATAMTFGPTTDAPRLVDDAIVMSAAVDDAIRAGRTTWQRIRWRLSLRSIRPATRSPIRP